VLELLEEDNGSLFPEALRFKRTHRREAPLHKCRCGTGLIGAYSGSGLIGGYNSTIP
jgi:hypothetical protein